MTTLTIAKMLLTVITQLVSVHCQFILSLFFYFQGQGKSSEPIKIEANTMQLTWNEREKLRVNVSWLVLLWCPKVITLDTKVKKHTPIAPKKIAPRFEALASSLVSIQNFFLFYLKHMPLSDHKLSSEQANDWYPNFAKEANRFSVKMFHFFAYRQSLRSNIYFFARSWLCITGTSRYNRPLSAERSLIGNF